MTLKVLSLAFLVSINSWAIDPGSLTSDFIELSNRHKVGLIKDQAFCYENDGATLGYQVDKLQRIASVTKLFTTLMVSETTDLRKTFTTRVYVGKDRLHIEGSRDPYFEEEKMLLLIQSLNKLGHRRFKQVSFNKDFKFYDVALESFLLITPNETRSRLQYYLSPGSKTFIRNIWKGILKFSTEENVTLDPTLPALQADAVVLSEVNPLLSENPQVYVHTSRPLHQILKAMNVMSKNTVSQNVYDDAAKIKSFTQLASQLQLPANTFRIYNGSGLPIINRSGRLDNQATCRTVLVTVKRLTESLSKHGLRISDVAAVSGRKDLGTFRDRFHEDPQTNESVVAKTGTLKHTSSIAGLLFIDEKIPFSILNHSTNALAARKFQDLFISRFFQHLGSADPIEYQKISTFPVKSPDFMIQTHE
ncbi:MAG TPA: D-alanyl-D-alanine carboxypeptidase [Bacteriovoracaceae bacterium]|nr:D-alanyl-D-alanine carboxypeptidase [Bacteriovoracaceae bacterium]